MQNSFYVNDMLTTSEALPLVSMDFFFDMILLLSGRKGGYLMVYPRPSRQAPCAR
jgi:arginine exporter protein ArgO